ncbi:GNAT family N-acetyltransferase [Oricola sp.]|uniref:GNAT family N-acetyltransferase n=1 Tax=Oricola sp. TaxID=1979950 RepID=UPI003BAD739D
MNSLIVDIRPADENDAFQIAEVHAAAWQNAYAGIIPHASLRRMIARRHGEWWRRAIRRNTSVMVVDLGGSIAGYCTYGLNRAHALSQEGEIYELYIRPEYQGIGVGTRLFRAAKNSLRDHGCKGLVIWALEDNTIAAQFYTGLGGHDIAQGFETFEGRRLRKVAYVWN